MRTKEFPVNAYTDPIFSHSGVKTMMLESVNDILSEIQMRLSHEELRHIPEPFIQSLLYDLVRQTSLKMQERMEMRYL